MIGALALLAMTLFGSLGALFFKRAAQDSRGLTVLLASPQLYLGGCFYGLGALLNIALLRAWEYSIVYPLTALTYVWTIVMSRLVLGERLTVQKAAGVALILCGVMLLTR